MGLELLDNLHGIAFPKKTAGGNAALDAMDKEDLSMDTADLGGFESAVSDIEQNGEDTGLLLDDPSAAAFALPQDNTAPQDSLVAELEANNAINANNPSFNLKDSIIDVNQYFSSLEGGANLSDQSTFMNRLAATESAYGSNTLGDYSYGQFQIDPIKYQDIVDRSQTGNAKLRADAANKFLRGKLGDENFDILSILDVDAERDEQGRVTSAKYRSNQALTDHNPLIAATLARLGLGNVPASIPEGIVAQGQYWKDHWNKSGAGDITGSEFVHRGTAHGYGDDPQEDTPIPNLNKVWDN